MSQDPEELSASDVLGMLTGSAEDLAPRPWWMPVSRPCYDKFRRCPGWAGGGERYAKVRRCDGGYIRFWGEDGRVRRLWRWRCYRCPKCRVIVLPYNIRYADWRWWRAELQPFRLRRRFSRLSDWVDDRWARYVPEHELPGGGPVPWGAWERVPFRRFAFDLLVVTPVYRLWGVEWDENWRAWPHCCTQGGCWAHVKGQYCGCGCRWCRAARRIDRLAGRRTARQAPVAGEETGK